MIAAPTRVFPLASGGSAESEACLLGTRRGLAIADRTHWPRFGIKGPGAADWLAAAGVALPAMNRRGPHGDASVLRLGRNDVMLIASEADSAAPEALRRTWEETDGPRGYSSYREDAWGWLHLSGHALGTVLSRLCAVDLRPAAFGPVDVAQTRFAGMDAVVLRDDSGADVLFDIASTADILRNISHAAEGATA